MSSQLSDLFSNIDSVTDERIRVIQKSTVDFKRSLIEWCNSSHPVHSEKIDDILIFIEKLLQWREERFREYHIMFEEVMWGELFNVFQPLSHFIDYYIFDDGWFNVVWFKYDVVAEDIVISEKIVQFPTGKVDVVEADFEDPDSWPVVVPDYTVDGGTQDIRVIIDAMVKYEEKLLKSKI